MSLIMLEIFVISIYIYESIYKILCTRSFAMAYKYRTNDDVQFNNNAQNIQR